MSLHGPAPGPAAGLARAAAGREPRRGAGALAGYVVLVAGFAALATALPAAWLLVLEGALVLALFAVATNLLLGYGGLVSFGQASFYGLGAYVVAIGWAQHALSFWTAFVLSPLAGGVAALLLGALALRTQRFYFALLTLAFSQLFFTVAEKWYGFTGGDNGIFGQMLPAPLADPRAGYLFVLGVTVVCLAILSKVTASPFGLVLRAVRENRQRAEALGLDVYRHQLLAFVLSGAFCAIAGVLSVVHDQAAYPQLLDWTKSGDPVLVSVIGGMFNFLGPVLGALIYQTVHDVVVQYTRDWQLVLGIVLLAIVQFAPDGVLGLIARGRPSRGLRPAAPGGDG